MGGFSLRLLVYILFAVVVGGGLYYDIKYLRVGNESMWEFLGYGGKFKFLTFIDMWIQAVYWTLVIAAEFAGQTSSVRKLADFFHASLAFPVGIFVCSTFWSIFLYDRELIHPKDMEFVLPVWLNHVMHTVHAPFLLVDKFVTRRRYPSFTSGVLTLVMFAAAYQCWILFLGIYKDIWVYPILKVLNWNYRIVFFAVLWCFFIVLYQTGHFLTRSIRGTETKRRSTKVN